MINKIYVKIKKIIKDNYLFLLFYLVLIATMLYPLPYYIYTGGGTIDIENKIKMDKEYNTSGNMYMCYVSQLHATIPSYLLAKMFSSWDIVSREEIVLNDREDVEDSQKRDKVLLEEANQSAVFVAYQHAEKEIEIIDRHPYIIYLDQDSDTDLKIGDDILEIEGNLIHSVEDISNILIHYEVGDKVSFKVERNNKILDKYATVMEKNDKKQFGIAITTIFDYQTVPDINFSFSNAESGPSGGLMITLAIYNKLIPEDISKGFKIAGTGTIDQDGKVGSIGGVKYKLKGAVTDKADIFIVPNGENYEECIQLQKKYGYDIQIIGVSTFEEAITKLSRL